MIEIPGYEIIGTLGVGGMGIVYLAKDTFVEDREVAIKVAKGPNHRIHLDGETRILTKLSHTHINKLYGRDFLSIDGQKVPYLVLECIKGRRPVDNYCAQMPVAEKIHYFLQVCLAITKAHGQRIVHCDIKASNVLVDESGSLYVTDFGLAVVLEAEDKVCGVIGTASYMSPEAARGDAIDERTDIYSLGILLYLILEGVLPYSLNAQDEKARAKAIEKAAITKPSNTPPQLFDVIKKCLRKNRADRYRTVKQIIDDIEKARKATSNFEHPIKTHVRSFKKPASAKKVPRFEKDTDFRKRLLEESKRFAADAIVKEVGQLAEKHSASSAWLFLVDQPDYGEPQLRLYRNLSQNTPIEGKKEFCFCWENTPRALRSIVGRVAATCEPYIAYDTEDDPYYSACQSATKSELAVPLFTHGESGEKLLIGVLNLESSESNAFLPHHVGGVISMVVPLARQLDVYVSCLRAEASEVDYAWHPERFGWDIKAVFDEMTSAASAWLSKISSVDATRESLPSCSIWHFDPNDEELFVVSTSRFDHEYVSKFTLPLQSFTGSLQSLEVGEVVFIENPSKVSFFVRKGKVSIMGVEAVMATKVDVAAAGAFRGFRGSINVYFFRGTADALKEDNAAKWRISQALLSLAENLTVLVQQCISQFERTIHHYALDWLNCRSLAGLSDQSGLATLVSELTRSSGCTIFTKCGAKGGEASQVNDVLQGVASSCRLIDSQGESVDPKDALYFIDEELDSGLTVSIYKNPDKVVRLNSTEPSWRRRLSHVSKSVLNKYRESFSLTESEHRPFIGVAVSSGGKVVGVIRAVRNSNSAPYTVFDELVIRVLSQSCSARFACWANRVRPSDLKLFYNLGIQFPSIASLIRDDKPIGILRSLRRLAAPLPDDALWTYPHLDAILQDLLAILEPLKVRMCVLRVADMETHRMRILTARSPLSKNPLGAYEFSLEEEGEVGLEWDAVQRRMILSNLRPTAIVSPRNDGGKTRVICFPFNLVPGEGNARDLIHCVLTVEVDPRMAVSVDALTAIHLACIRLSCISMVNMNNLALPASLLDWSPSLQLFLQELKTAFPLIHACDIIDKDGGKTIARCQHWRNSDLDEWWNRRNPASFQLGRERLGRAGLRQGYFSFDLRFGGFKTNFTVRCCCSESSWSKEDVLKLMSNIDSFWHRFVVSKSGRDVAPMLYVLFHRESVSGNEQVWSGLTKCTINFLDLRSDRDAGRRPPPRAR